MKLTGKESLEKKQGQLDNYLDIWTYLDEELRKAQNRNAALSSSNNHLQRMLNQNDLNFRQLLGQAKGNADSEISSLTIQIQTAKAHIEASSSDKADMLQTEATRARLERELEDEKKLMKRQIADKEKEKVIETHELNQNITKKIDETKAALQDLKKEQLETTRRYFLVIQTDSSAEQPAHG